MKISAASSEVYPLFVYPSGNLMPAILENKAISQNFYYPFYPLGTLYKQIGIL